MRDSHGLRLARLGLAGLALLGSITIAPAASALGIRDLSGWWIAIDDTFPTLWARSGVIPAEELLIINPDGRVENRAMNFWSGSARDCAEKKVCSDAPIIARARLTVKGDRLGIGNVGGRAARIDTERTDPLIRRAAATAAAEWIASSNGRVLTLRSTAASNVTRTFARVEPRRLQRLRAGFRVSQQSASRQWRCFLANATASDPAFAPLRSDKAAAPGFLAAYLRVASYLNTLDSLSVRPTPDDPAGRRYLGYETEEIMVEEFPDTRLPVSASESRELRARIALVMQRASGGTVEGPRPRLPVSDGEIAAFGRALGDDPEAKRLFCRE